MPENRFEDKKGNKFVDDWGYVIKELPSKYLQIWVGVEDKY